VGDDDPAPTGAIVTRPDDWVFAVDFGTTNTVAAVGGRLGVRSLMINGRTAIPSAVMLQERGGWHVGELAINAARRNLAWFEPRPKSAIGAGSLFLGGRSVPVVDAIAAVLRFVAGEAQKQHGTLPPARYVVTHPAGWGSGRIDTLLDAARNAIHRSWPAPEPLPEPVAAAQGVFALPQVSREARIVVLDLGGGTVDVATVDRLGSQLTVIGTPRGIDAAAGEEFDLRLARVMTSEAGEDRLYDKLIASAAARDLELALDIRTAARGVKEQLSLEPVVPIAVPVPKGPDEIESRPVQISRAQLEAEVQGGVDGKPGLIEAVRLVKWGLEEAPYGPNFEGVYLVGGSSRIPLLGRLVQQEIGRAPISHGDPGVAVAEGAAAWALRTTADTATSDDVEETRPEDPDEGPQSGLVDRVFGAISGFRPLLGALVIAVLVGGVGWLFLSKPDPSCPPTTTRNANGQCAVIQTETPKPQPTAAGVPGCTTAGTPDCAAAIRNASRSVWPGMPTDGCSTNDSVYGVDLYSTECDSGTLSYNVFWRKSSGSVLAALAGQMITPTLGEFSVSGTELGNQLGGTRMTQSGWRFTCVWEYADFPVTMVLDGPNTDATVARCENAKFLDSAAMESASPPR
jgi:molecular chaperone DnaK